MGHIKIAKVINDQYLNSVIRRDQNDLNEQSLLPLSAL